MSQVTVTFTYHTGVAESFFHNVRLAGSWNAQGRYSEEWTVIPMAETPPRDSGRMFSATVQLDGADAGKNFFWGILLDTPTHSDQWGIMAESLFEDGAAPHGFHSGHVIPLERCRGFTLPASGDETNQSLSLSQEYRLTHCRGMGASKRHKENNGQPGISFSVWAPNALKVELVTATDDSGGYIWNDGKGVQAVYAMERGPLGVWSTLPDEPDMAVYAAWPGKPYMFRITREDGSVAYRTDMYSRRQAGRGGANPEEDQWSGNSGDLDCTKSCSVVSDPDVVHDLPASQNMHDTPAGEAASPGAENSSEESAVDKNEFWQHEFDPLRPLPTQAGNMIIYEMHIGGLGAGREGPGTLEDAMDMLDYLAELGINTIELLPMSAFEGAAGWGYGSSHFYAIKYDMDGRDLFKRFVRACHRRGIAVIVDVVYNHYTPNSERCQWMYDSSSHDHNIYYYYHGNMGDYPGDFPEGGYCDNLSTGYLPDMAQEIVRKMLIGSAVNMLLEYHVDGFRMDLTQALHSYNVLHADGSPVAEANEAGIRFMREWAGTIRLFKPKAILIAEDHSGWNMLARSGDTGGIGFDTSWWAEWYHQLVGDSSQDDSKALLLRNAGYGTNKPLKMNIFGGMLQASAGKVVYHESHDESGNSANSARNMEIAVNYMLFDNTREWAEARCRVIAGATLLSAGTPMFFMGEEVCASQPYRHDDFLEHREDYKALRESTGAGMFRFYRDIIRLRLDNAALRSPLLEVLRVHNQDRLLSFRRWLGDDEFLVLFSLNNTPLNSRAISHRSLKGKIWREILNSDAPIYNGHNTLNPEQMDSQDGVLHINVPACGITVLYRVN